MKITSIELYSNGQNSAVFSFRDPAGKNPYIVQGIFGLDADEIVPKFYGLSSDGSSKYYDMGLKSREIVIRVALNPNLSLRKTYSDLRDDLYRVISASRTGKIELRLYNGTAPVASIFGLVSKFEAPHFNQLPEVQLTIKCEDPMFRAVKPVEVDFFVLSENMNVRDPFSTSPHGFSFSIKFDADTPDFTIEDPQEGSWSFTVTPGIIGANTGFKEDDVLYFSSEFGERKVYILRGATTILLVDKVQTGSIWPMMFPGSNHFQIITGAFLWETFSYYPTYWGV